MSQAQLDLFKANLPRKPRAGDDKAYCTIMQLKHAVNKAYIQHNPPTMIHWLMLDVDHSNMNIWEDKSLPVPNYIARNPENGKYHCAYAIRPVCRSENANLSNLRLLALVEYAYKKAFEADMQYAGYITKNPLSHKWDVYVYHSDIADLYYLSDFNAIDLDTAAEELWSSKKSFGYEPAGFSRNCDLFDLVRYWAYSQVASYDSHSTFLNACLHKAEAFNKFDPPLEYNEVQSVAKSIARWTWQNRAHFANYKQVDRGAMNLSGSQLTLQEKQSAAAEWTNLRQRNSSEAAIKEAIVQLKDEGKRVTKAAAARLVGMSRTQVSMYYGYLF